MVWSVRSYFVVRRHVIFLVSYQIIGLVFFSNFFSLIMRICIYSWKDPSTQNGLLIVESICISLINSQCLIEIFFVRKQWLTTRKQLYRQSVLPSDKEFYRKQIVRHRYLFQAL